jgi:hypothetical protein
MTHQTRTKPSWLQELPLPIRLRLLALLALELLFSGLGGAALAVIMGQFPLSPFLTAGFGLVGVLLLGLAGYFLWYSSRVPGSPLSQYARKQLGRAWAALALVLLWYIFGGLMMAFLLDNFFGWDHLPLGLAVLAGFHLVPVADAFQKPHLLLWGLLMILLAVVLIIGLPNDPAGRAQILGIWLNILFWTLALDQLRNLHQQIRR